MCYSAKVYAEVRDLERKLGLRIDPDWYAEVFWIQRGRHPFRRKKMPRSLEREALELAPPNIQAAVREADQAEIDQLTQEIFMQRSRVVAAERSLQKKDTKKAREDIRIGTDKVERAQRRLDELKAPSGGEGRIYPGYFAPVVVLENGRYVARPMRYQCRLPGWTAKVERSYPGTYNARRDKLETAWRQVFGHNHGVLLASAFYEHVDRDGRDQVLEFKPSDGRDMIVACLWTLTQDEDGEPMYTFAAVTDDPPAEVAEAGHDRCVVPIKAEHLDAWLTPKAHTADELQGILEGRERPYYAWREAA